MTFNVKSSKIIKETVVSYRGFKAFICWVFSIVPEKSYGYKVEVKVDMPTGRKMFARPNDMVLDENETRWVITSVDNDKLVITSVQMSPYKIRRVYGQMIYFSSAFREI